MNDEPTPKNEAQPQDAVDSTEWLGRSWWIVVNVGCIECGVSTNIVGVFDDKARADSLADSLSKSHGWREGGQNHFEVFELPKPNAINAEYLAEGAP